MTEILDVLKKNFDNIEPIGNCHYGFVYKGKLKNKNELRAIKVMDLDKIRSSFINLYDEEEVEGHIKSCIDGFIQEYENMKICSENNMNSVKCYEYFQNENYFVIIMELCDSNLDQLLMERIKKTKTKFKIDEILEIMKELNNTFKIMKEKNIIHRDLKLENILIKYGENNKKIMKITDYGCSKRLISLSRNCNSNKGTIMYMAPEILEKILEGEEGEYNYKCDLWSIGIIIYKLYFGKSPFPGLTEKAIINNINEYDKGRKAIKKTGYKELDDLIKNLLQKESSKRLNWEQYFNHPFFKNDNTNNINLIYYINEDSYKDWIGSKIEKVNILGKEFVEKNKDNIELIINGKKTELSYNYKLEYGEYKIQIIIKNNINNLEGMFVDCRSLKNIEGLEYLDTKEINNFSHMFRECESLSDLKPLQNWNVSNGNNFSVMFYEYKSLSDLKPLQNWNVSNGNDFGGMFGGWKSLTDLKPLQIWNVSNGNDFSYMFYECKSLSDLKPLQNWNISNGYNFSYMFCGCKSLSDLKPLQNWKFSNRNDFRAMFSECESLSDLKPLQNWNISNGYNFSSMFSGCKSLSDSSKNLIEIKFKK